MHGSEFLLQQLINGLAWGSIYALIALGYTMVYGVLRLINFAHGDVYMVGAFIGFYTANRLGIADHPTVAGIAAVIVLPMILCALLGILIERCAYRPLRAQPRLTILITAIGVSLFLENGGQLVFGADPKFFPQIIEPRSVVKLGQIVISNQQLLIVVVSVVLMTGLQLMVMKTKVGKAMRAVSFDRTTANLMGINTDNIISFTFALGSALAAAAGVLVALNNPKIEPLMGIMPGLKAFVAAVLGGIGNIPGAVLGGLIMGVVENLVAGYLSSSYKDVIAFALLIIILLFKPTGILGKGAVEKV